MTHSRAGQDLRWRSYWRRSPLMLQARLGDRVEEGLAEALALLCERPAAAFALTGDEMLDRCQARIREAGFGLLRLQAEAAGATADVLLIVGAPAPGAPGAVSAAARGISREAGVPWLVLSPGDDVAARLEALARLVLEPHVSR